MKHRMPVSSSAEKIREFYDRGFWRGDTIYGLVRDHAGKTPDKAAVREKFRTVTYGELVDAADRLADALAGKGLGAGERVAVWLPSRIETAAALLACSRNGYVCCPSLHRDHRTDDIAELLERTGAAALIAEAGYGAGGAAEDIFRAASGIESLKYVLKLDPRAGTGTNEDIFPSIGPARMSLEIPGEIRTDPDTIVYLAFTSGTTGRPKGVMHSDNTLLANARGLAADWSLGTDMVVYSLSPLSHNLGWGARIMTLTGGGEFIVHDLGRGESLLGRLIGTGATFLFGVPTHAIDLLAELRNSGSKDVGRLKGFRVSGASVPPVVAAGLLQHGITPQSGYGMTEAGSHHYTLPGDDPRAIIETSGKACPGYEVKIFSSDDPEKELPPGETGQIGGRGASLMLGYFDDSEAFERAFNSSGWFMTGDMGWLDQAGYIHVTGRKKDVIIRGGHNINPAKIENLALRHEAVERAAVIPIADERLGEKVCIAVQLRGGASMDAEELLAHLDECKLSKYDMPEYFLELDDIPLTPSGKVFKRDLVAWVEEGRIKPAPVRIETGD